MIIYTYLLEKLGIKGIIIAGIFTAMTFIGGFLYADNKYLSSSLKKARETVGIMQTQETNLCSVLTAEKQENATQIESLKKLKIENDILDSRVQAASVAIESIKKSYTAEASRIPTATIPKNCNDAVTWLGSEADEIVKSWNAPRDSSADIR